MQPELARSPLVERAVVAACLMDPGAAIRVAEVLTDEDFAEPALRCVFESVRSVLRAGKGVDVLTVLGDLELRGKVDEVGGIGFLTGLDVDLPALGELSSYLEQLRDRSARRRLIELAREVSQEAASSPSPALEIVSWTRTQVDAIEREGARGRGEFEPVGEAVTTIEGELDLGPRQLVGLPSGLPDLDQRTLGFCPGQLIIVAGRPGSGKSALAQQIATHVAKASRVVGWFSLEMSRVELGHRLLAQRAQVQHNLIRSRYLSATERSRVLHASTALRALPLHIDDSSGLTVVDLEARARRLKVSHGLDLLLVDYLHLLTPIRPSGNRSIDIGEMTRSLKVAARTLNVPIVLLSQLNRLSEHRSDRRPMLADLRESGAIEQDADMVIMVHRPLGDDGLPGIDCELLLVKNRAGELADIDVNFLAPFLTFQSRDHRQSGEEEAA